MVLKDIVKSEQDVWEVLNMKHPPTGLSHLVTYVLPTQVLRVVVTLYRFRHHFSNVHIQSLGIS